jgi:hypothetical protein
MFQFLSAMPPEYPRQGRPAQRQPRRPSVRLECEGLEDRLCPSPIGSTFLVNTKTALHQYESANASSANGRNVVVWTDQSYQGNTDIKAQVYDASGQKVGGEIAVAVSPRKEDQPAVAMDGVGNFAVVWTEQLSASNHNVQGARYAADDTLLDSFTVADSGQDEYGPSIAMAAGGDFVVSYTRNSTSQDIWGYTFYANGVPHQSFAVTASSRNDLNSRAAMAPDGRFAIAYETHYGSADSDVELVRYSAAGFWLSEQALGSSFNTWNALPDVSMDASGNCVVVYLSQHPGDLFPALKALRVTSNGLLGVELPLADAVSYARPAVALDPTNGKFVVAYDTVSGYLQVREVSPKNVVLTSYSLGANRFSPAVSIGGNHYYLLTYTANLDYSREPSNEIFGQYGFLGLEIQPTYPVF